MRECQDCFLAEKAPKVHFISHPSRQLGADSSKFMSKDCPFEKIYPSALNRDADYFMAHAYNQAIEAWKKDEVPIGAVIEHDGKIIASAHNQSRSTNDPTAHAEILAISQAAAAIGDWRLNACRLYVTKEPCPMCAGALVIARIGRVYYGLPDEKMGCVGGAIDLGALPRSNHHFDSRGGIMQEANHALLKAFFEKRRTLKSAKSGSCETDPANSGSAI